MELMLLFPTVSVEIPRVTLDKLQAVVPMFGGFNELVVFVKARTGVETAYGFDNGVFISTASSTTGNNTEKNMLQLTFTGDEDSMETCIIRYKLGGFRSCFSSLDLINNTRG